MYLSDLIHVRRAEQVERGKATLDMRHVRGEAAALSLQRLHTVSGQSSPPSLETMTTPVSQEGTCARFLPLASAHHWTHVSF
jgi:hypothetical protein